MPVEFPSPVEFISAVNINPSNELNRLNQAGIDLPFFRRYVNALEDAGFDYTLCAYASAFQDQFAIANQIVARSDRVTPIVALRPNTIYPTVAAKALAMLDQFGQGRAVVHFISGGNDAEQAREGDHLTKQQRYARTAEYIDIVRKVWTSTEPFSHEGEFYKFDNFVSLVRPTRGTIPVSVGGSSAEAYRVGGSRGDIFGLWGEPLAGTRQQIDAVNAEAARAGRTDRPRIWVTFRPIIAPTEELAWEKARHTLSVLEGNAARSAWWRRSLGGEAPQNVGSQRLLEIAARQDVHDRALWTPTASATGAAGASTALVGTPETVAAAILDYVDRGASLVSIRGYDTLADAVDYGRYVLPLVREELAHRHATGQRGTLQGEHLGNYGPRYSEYAAAASGALA
jgi:alkanesulfonate monooxygenase